MFDLVIVTATFFKPEESAYDRDVALPLTMETLKLAERHGLWAIVVDGSPDPEVPRALTRAGAEVIRQETPGFGPAVRQAVAAGARTIKAEGSVHWQEPMKADLVRFHTELAEAAKEADAAILVPRRGNATWPTYPQEQVWQELFTNEYVRIVSGGALRFDFTFGPKVFRRDGIELVAECDGRIWDALVVPVVRAVRMGIVVMERAVSYHHPSAQCRAEEGKPEWIKKRREQLIHVTTTLEEAWNAA